MNNLNVYQSFIPNVDEDLITNIENLQKQKIMNVIKPYYNFIELPDDLNPILIELTIYRFNIVGSEGLAQEDKLGKDIYDTNYEDKLLARCEAYAQEFADDENSKWKIKFL